MGLLSAERDLSPQFRKTTDVQLSSNVSQTQPEPAWALLYRDELGYVVMMCHALAPGTGDSVNFRLGELQHAA